MASHFRLYERPLMADETLPALAVVGELEGYVAEDAYSSRLQIINSVGRCTVEIVEANLPPGTSVRVDNLSKEVVVKWDAYRVVDEVLSAVPNGDFENGDDGTWGPGGGSNGAGWSIGTGPGYSTFSGTHSARFADIKTKGSDLVLPPIPAKVNDFIKVTAQIQQGASSRGNAGARVTLMYLAADRSLVLRRNGNLITNGGVGEWKESSAEANAPAGVAFVQVVLSAYRNKENKPLWADAVTWNHKYVLGQDSDETYFLHIKVTDSANRVAYWQGDIEELLAALTGQLMPVFLQDSIGIAAGPTGIRTLDEQNVLDSATIGAVPTGIGFLNFGPIPVTAPPEEAAISALPIGIRFFNTAHPVTVEPESASIIATAIGIAYKQHIAVTVVDSTTITATPIGINYA